MLRRWIPAVVLATAISLPASAEVDAVEKDSPSWELTAAEQRTARELAERGLDQTDLEKPGPLHYVGAELYRDKYSADRQARVIHYRIAGDVTVWTRVNLSHARVEERETKLHVPTNVSLEEYRIAREMVLNDEQVKRELGERIDEVEIEPMNVRTLDPKDPYFGHRVFRMLMKVGRDYLSRPVVIVNLTTNQVHIEASGLTGEGK